MATPFPSIVAFGSQTIWPTSDYLFQLRAALLLEPRLKKFLLSIKELPTLWQDLVAYDPRLRAVPGQECLDDLVEWVNHGEFLIKPAVPPNVLIMPFTIVIHIIQYFRYLSSLKTTQAVVLEHLKEGGAQGFCTGILTAVAVACSKSEEDVSNLAAVALKLAICIGAYVDLDGAFGKESDETTSIAVRWRSEAGRDRVLEILKSYPGAYISVIFDSTDVTITVPKSSVNAITERLYSQGMTVKPTGLEGRYHSQVHQNAVAKIFEFCNSRHDIGFPPAEKLIVPIRSNATAQTLIEGSLHEHAVRCIMLQLANWHLTISAAVSQLIQVRKPVAASFGLQDFIPSLVVKESGLTVNKIRSLTLIPSQLPGSQSEHFVKTAASETSSPQPNQYPDHAIAVVGMACKFPGADSIEEFWELLTSGTSMVEEMPKERFSTRGLRRSEDGKLKFWGNFVRDVDAFDHRFFKKSSREAATMDPQQRLLLQVAYEAMESSGYFSEFSATIPDDIGCYLGACANDYNDNVASHPPNAFSSLGTLRAFLSGKISHFFGWTGPSVTYDTACSSSAVAIHSACKAIEAGECSQALAGGVSLYTNPNFYQNLAAASFLSPSGPTKPFDARADGYCRGEGVGLVLLKKLSAALADRDNVLGVIAGSAVNQNSNATYITVPHSPSQISLYKRISSLAGIDPRSVSFVEAHGTGTPVGDPIEMASIREVFGGASRTKPLHVASVKGNIGHLEGASGVAALIKTLLMMQYKTIPIQASFTSLNPKIPALEPDRMEIPKSTQKWETEFQIACINNYGAAGSNAALIVCQPALGPAPNSNNRDHDILRSSRYPLFISAYSIESLQAYCTALQRVISLSPAPEDQLSSLVFNLAVKQNRSFSHVFATTISDLTDLDNQLTAVKSGRIQPQVGVKPKPVILCFGGQISNTIGLNKDVYDASTLLRSHLDDCDIAIHSLGLSGLYPEIFQTSPIEDIVRLQCLLFSLQYSCSKAWIDSGLHVDALIGHSFGQLTAMCVSGALSLEDGLKLVAGRASLMNSHWGPERGSMISVEADLGTVLNYMSSSKVSNAKENLEIACYNGPNSHVLVGAHAIIDRLQDELSIASIKHKRLNVTHGFHSIFTEPLLPGLYSLTGGLTFKKPVIALQTCTEEKNCDQLGPRLVVDHTRTPVYFRQAVERLGQSLGPSTWLEAGSGSSVTAMVSRALDPSTSSLHTFQSIQLGTTDAIGSLANATVNLWKSGHNVQFWPFHRSQRQQYRAINLPPYQFAKSRHWLSWLDNVQLPAPADFPKALVEPEHMLLSLTKFRDQKKRDADFSIDLVSKEYEFYVQGHAVLAEPLCPAPLYIELASRAAMMLITDGVSSDYIPCLDDLEINAPLGMNVDQTVSLHMKRIDDEISAWNFEVTSEAQSDGKGSSSKHATGRVTLQIENSRLLKDLSRYKRLIDYQKIDDLKNDAGSEIMQGATIYRMFSKVVQYADYYKGVRSIYAKGNQVAGTVVLPDDDRKNFQDHITRPIAVDNFIQVAGLHVNCLTECGYNEVFVCTKVERIQFSSNFKQSKSWVVYSSFASLGGKQIVNDIFVFDVHSKELVLMVLGAQFMKVLISSLAKVLSRANISQSHTKNTNGASVDLKTTKLTQPLPNQNYSLVPAASNTGTDAKKSFQDDNALVVDSDIRKLLHRVTDVSMEDIKDDSTMDDLGIDSLMITEVMSEVCKFFELDISATDFSTLQDIKSLRTYLIAKGFGGRESATISDSSSESEESSPSATPTITTISSVEDLNSLQNDLTSSLAKLVEGHLETTASMTRQTNLADQGLDSLLSIELANDIKKNFDVMVDMSLFDSDSTFGDLLDTVLAQNQPTAPTMKIETLAAGSSPAISTNLSAVPSTPPSNNRPASLRHAQQAFEDIRFDYDIFTKQTKFADFWKKVYPAQARLVVAYTVEAFATLGCRLASLSTGQRLPRVQSLPKHKLLMDQLGEILKDASLVESDGISLIRSGVLVDPTSSKTLFQEILVAFPHHASEHKLLDVTGSRLAECLTGAADPLQLLFRNKENKELLEDVYTNGPMYEAITKLLASFLQRAYETNAEGGTFHILELGGGTGGTTKYIIDFLANQGISFTYVFTDLAGSLVTAAKKKFAGLDFMEFKVLDVEKSPPKDFLNKFHTIISTNCIHATRNLEISTSNIRQMLRPDGFVSLVEFTRNMFWFDLVFGLLDGWWLYEDGRKHVLASETFWDRSMQNAGFKHVTWSDGRSEEAKTLRIITAFLNKPTSESFKPKIKSRKPQVETLVYKQAGKTTLKADVYIPPNIISGKRRPIALLIHGGGHVMFTRKEVNLKQIELLHSHGFLPVSVDYRFCPELNILDGPMNDIREALGWSRLQLPYLAPNIAPGLEADGEKVVAVGWSTGGHLAMTLAFTAPELQLRAPEAILGIYCPTDYESDWWKSPIYPKASVSSPSESYDLLEGVQKDPIASYYPPVNNNHPGMLMSLADPRWRFVLHMNWRAQTVPFLLGLPSQSASSSSPTPEPTSSQIAAISPYAQIVAGAYHSPTFLLHGRPDDMIPWQQSMRTIEALKAKGVEADIEIIEGARHLFDTFPEVGVDFEPGVRRAYEWLTRFV